MKKYKMKKGSLNFVSIAMFSMTLVLVISALGYTVGYANQNYNTTFNTNISGVDIMSEDYAGLEYFTNATQISNVSYNSTAPFSGTGIGQVGFITEIITPSTKGTWVILSDIINLTPLGLFRSLLANAILLIGLLIGAIILAQFLFNRNLTS